MHRSLTEKVEPAACYHHARNFRPEIYPQCPTVSLLSFAYYDIIKSSPSHTHIHRATVAELIIMCRTVDSIPLAYTEGQRVPRPMRRDRAISKALPKAQQERSGWMAKVINYPLMVTLWFGRLFRQHHWHLAGTAPGSLREDPPGREQG